MKSAAATGPTIPCPKCRKVFKAENWHRDGMPCCQRCSTVYELVDFPALYQSPENRPESTADALPEDASCFFHAQNRAEQVCEGCGRFLCPVCTVNFGGRKLCPSCIAQGQTKAPEAEQGRILWDGIALNLALLPPLLVVTWMFSLITAPVALGIAIFGWNRPTSLVRGSRVRLVLAMVLATVQIGAWIYLFASLLLKP